MALGIAGLGGLVAVGTAAAQGTAHGAEAAPHAAEAVAKSVARAASAAPTAPSARSAPRADPLRDPLDRLRERLAQKLGASQPPGSTNPNLLRVVAKSGATTSIVGGEIVTSGAVGHVAAGRRVSPGVAPGPTPSAMSGVVPGQAHWDYAGAASPEHWAELKPEFAKCANGARQSPIDIRDGLKVDLDPVAFDYRPGAFKVVDNGHTVQVNVAPGSSIEVTGRRYELVQFHFHRPSEERIDGRQFDMVVHLVHRDLEGRLAVVAVLLDRGSALQAVQSVWNNLPLEKGDEVAARTLLDPTDLLPTDRSYYTYMGSLTTPPCSEGVLWMVMKKPMPVSAEQIAIFARLYPMNARPIQSAAGRMIKESN